MGQEVGDYLLSIPRKISNFGSKYGSNSSGKQDNSEGVKAANETFRKRAEAEKDMSKKGVGVKKVGVRKRPSKRTGSAKSYGGK